MNFANGVFLNSTLVDKFWIYAVEDNLGQLVFMSYGTLKEIVSMYPFKTNEKFVENAWYRYCLIQPCDNKIQAENALNSWLKKCEDAGEKPLYNQYTRIYNNDKFIQCLENGRYYKTAQDIVKIFNVSQPALSNVLRGVPGFKTVRGLHFKYVFNVQPDIVETAGGFALTRTELGGYKYELSDDPLNKKDISNAERESIINELKFNNLACAYNFNGGNADDY